MNGFGVGPGGLQFPGDALKAQTLHRLMFSLCTGKPI
jgi:hypothetical protein